MPNSNNSINNTVGTSNSGGLNTLTVQNTDNTSTSSHANVNITVSTMSSGNPSTEYTIPGTNNFTFEVNNSANSSLELLSGATPVWTMSRKGQQNLPLQPAFKAYFALPTPPGTPIPIGSSTSNPGNQYNIGNASEDPAVIYTVQYDTRSSFNTTHGYYVIPETGIYYFIGGIDVAGIVSSDLDAQLSIAVATNAATFPNRFRQQAIDIFQPAPIRLADGQCSFIVSGFDHYTAGQVVWMRIFLTGTSGAGNHCYMQTNDPGNQFFNFFAGHRVA